MKTPPHSSKARSVALTDIHGDALDKSEMWESERQLDKWASALPIASQCMPVEAGRASSSLLAINGGSSSIRFAVFEDGECLRLRLHGKVDRIGSTGTNLTFRDAANHKENTGPISFAEGCSSVKSLLDWLEAQHVFVSIKAVGHRIVHGMGRHAPVLVTADLIDELHKIIPYSPEHLPLEIALIEEIRRRYPALPQAACFDTAFHRTMPHIAHLFPIPRRAAAAGVRRYGFHGLSYEFLMEELARLGDRAAIKGRVILAHLGNGASMAAVCDGESVDTSMGLTPTGGLMMGSRSGDLDPGIFFWFARNENMNALQFEKMVSHESGLLGVSGISSDIRELLAREAHDDHAAEALALFCYQAKKWIGSFSAVLGGLDTLVFAGGIGENAPIIRERICENLGFLGIELNSARNMKNAGLISTDGSEVAVRVIRTDEELMIARSVKRALAQGRQEER